MLWFNTVVVVVIVVVVVVAVPPTPLAMLVRLLEALNNVLGIIGGFMGRSWVWFSIFDFGFSISIKYNRIRDEYESTTNHNMKVNKIQNKRIYGYQLAIST